MPKLERYTYTGPVDNTVIPDKSKLKGKSVIVTGGANGIGEALVRSLVAADAFVTIGDNNVSRGEEIAKELGLNAQFIKCDILSWDDQVSMFEAAQNNSPHKSVDIVIANAGIGRGTGDSLFKLDDCNGPPVKPALMIAQVNILGTMYTWKLAAHYFRKQPDDVERDRSFIITGSMGSYTDSPGSWEYTASKHAVKGLMRTVRRSSWSQGIRINVLAPYYVKSAIRTPEMEAFIYGHGVRMATPEDCVAAMMRLACDRTINGHSLIIVGEAECKEGYRDAENDDHTEGFFKEVQDRLLRINLGEWSEEGIKKESRKVDSE
ncbi:short chain dehydrogenase/ reductase [Hyaloscypha variabilis F]|uniref:Short chain dehydrogenase/ reductase n=1 Tax=Hyaloscypha variabilis (strain UAMH 11265 / GT02V1 / F) TaxID=1149755 RepID=A0A2J6RH87_HYAVF|nr:short chain dehydrogenase/ reductase [Hyaloscypha variabilis F]